MNFAQIEEFQVIGIEARTSNAKEMTPEGIIPRQWQKAMSAPQLGSDIVALYTDYESDEHGEYTFVIGAKANPLTRIPEGMVVKTVPAGNYAVFTSERGPVSKVVIDTWRQIWSSGCERTFHADFEIYDERAADPANAQVDIYVGVK